MAANISDTTILQDVSKSVDQLCSQLTLSNIMVPKFSSSKDVFDFIIEYEAATATVSDDQKGILLSKSFPPGHQRAWFETELAPLIKSRSPWLEQKMKIINRFSETAEKERHFIRLREMKFNPEGEQKLLDFIEDIIFSYNKAYPNSPDVASQVQFVKASIPGELRSTLTMIAGYREAKTLDDLKKAIRQFDYSKSSTSSSKCPERLNVSELTSMLKEVMLDIKKQGENTQKAIIAALDTNRGEV